MIRGEGGFGKSQFSIIKDVVLVMMLNIPDPGDREVVPVVDLAGQVGGDSLPDLHHLAGVGAEEGFGDPQVIPDAVPVLLQREWEAKDGATFFLGI